MKIFLSSLIAIILSTTAFSIEELPKHHCENVYEFCEQGVRIADYHLQIYNHINPQNYVHGYWQGQKDAYISIQEILAQELTPE